MQTDTQLDNRVSQTPTLVPARLAQRLAGLEERAQLVVKQGQRRRDRHVHVQVPVSYTHLTLPTKA